MTQRFGAFSNPIVGGDGVLIRESIRSPNYVPGVSGWTINKDGTASFNSTTINGDLKVVGADGSVVWIREFDNAAVIQMYPPIPDPNLHQAEFVSVIEFPLYPTLLILGPYYDDNPANEPADLHLRTDPDGAIAEMHAKFMGIGPYSLGSTHRPGSYISIFPESVIFLTDTITTGNVFLNSVNGLASGAQVGMDDGKFYEKDGAGNLVRSVRFSAVASVTTTSTTFVPNPAATTEGLAFRAPSSGNVRIQWAGAILNSSATGATIVGYELRIGATIGSGTVVNAATDDVALENNGNVTRASGTFDEVTGLTPGLAYNVRLMYRSGGASTATAARRRLSVTPILY